jgi:hypothetical protein
MAAIATVGSTQGRAKKRFPYTAPQHIRGSGEYCLVFKCHSRWRVNLYPTAADRDAAWEKYQFSSCGAYNCTHDHDRANL